MNSKIVRAGCVAGASVLCVLLWLALPAGAQEQKEAAKQQPVGGQVQKEAPPQGAGGQAQKETPKQQQGAGGQAGGASQQAGGGGQGQKEPAKTEAGGGRGSAGDPPAARRDPQFFVDAILSLGRRGRGPIG